MDSVTSSIEDHGDLMVHLEKKRNRRISRTATKESYYCGGCDCNYVVPGGKCSVCGWRERHQRKLKDF